MSTAKDLIPADFYRKAWLESEAPMVCVDRNHRMISVNYSFAGMLGYSVRELEGKTWMEVTRPEFLGGDMLSVGEMVEGKVDKYRLEKQYIHKLGHYIAAVLTVRRYPVDKSEPLLYFQVEAVIPMHTTYEMQQTLNNLKDKISAIEGRENKEHDRVSVNIGDRTGGDKVIGNINSDQAIKIMAGALVAMGVTMAWLFYYVAATHQNQPVTPPAPITLSQGQE